MPSLSLDLAKLWSAVQNCVIGDISVFSPQRSAGTVIFIAALMSKARLFGIVKVVVARTKQNGLERYACPAPMSDVRFECSNRW